MCDEGGAAEPSASEGLAETTPSHASWDQLNPLEQWLCTPKHLRTTDAPPGSFLGWYSMCVCRHVMHPSLSSCMVCTAHATYIGAVVMFYMQF